MINSCNYKCKLIHFSQVDINVDKIDKMVLNSGGFLTSL